MILPFCNQKNGVGVCKYLHLNGTFSILVFAFGMDGKRNSFQQRNNDAVNRRLSTRKIATSERQNIGSSVQEDIQLPRKNARRIERMLTMLKPLADENKNKRNPATSGRRLLEQKRSSMFHLKSLIEIIHYFRLQNEDDFWTISKVCRIGTKYIMHM